MQRQTRSRGRLIHAIQGYLFIAPWLVGLVVFMAVPLGASFGLSFFRWSLIRPPTFVGVENYVTMFTDDPLFWKSLRVTMIYVAVAVPLQIAFSLFLALLLNQRVRMLPVFRTIFYMPSVVGLVAVAVVWGWLYQPEFGLINDLLRRVGIEGPAWLISKQWALPAIIGASLWTVGATMIIFLAGLQNIPRHLYEAAALDGAGEVGQFRHVTLPMLSPVIFFNLILRMIEAFRMFDIPLVMTDGGPLNATMFYALYLYLNAFTFLKAGYAAALSWILFVVILVVTVVQLRLARRWVYYEFE